MKANAWFHVFLVLNLFDSLKYYYIFTELRPESIFLEKAFGGWSAKNHCLLNGYCQINQAQKKQKDPWSQGQNH